MPHLENSIFIIDQVKFRINFNCNQSTIVYWNDFSEDNNSISIPKLIEENCESYKSKFLEWTYLIGNQKSGSKDFVSYLKIRDNFSAWWFSLLVEKSNIGKSKYIEDIIRLIAFSDLVQGRNIKILYFCLSNRKLKNIFKKYCDKNNIKFVNLKSSHINKFSKYNFKKFYFNLPNFFQAIFWVFFKTLSSLPLKGVGINEWIKNKNSHIFISYLDKMANIDSYNFLESPYWGSLPNILEKDSKRSNWIHIFVKDNYLKNPKEASIHLKNMNKFGSQFQSHAALYSFMNFRVLLRVFNDLFKLFLNSLKIQFENNLPELCGFQLWDIYEKDILSSAYGQTCADNLLNLNLFEEAFQYLNNPRNCSYLLENQGWELSMLSSWRRYTKSQAIGFCHATVRFWDLRYFSNKNQYLDNSDLSKPRPDILAVNSSDAYSLFKKANYPINELARAESLRHLYIEKYLDKFNAKKNNSGSLKLIVLGDYFEFNTEFQLSLLNSLSSKTTKKLKIILKPHPSSRIKESWYSSLDLEIKNNPLKNLLPEADIVFTSLTTSAAVDAYCFGLKVITALDPNTLNLSPLREKKDVYFVKSSFELENVLIKLIADGTCKRQSRRFFYIDKDLNKWKRFLY